MLEARSFKFGGEIGLQLRHIHLLDFEVRAAIEQRGGANIASICSGIGKANGAGVLIACVQAPADLRFEFSLWREAQQMPSGEDGGCACVVIAV